jgi:hypothetical protein
MVHNLLILKIALHDAVMRARHLPKYSNLVLVVTLLLRGGLQSLQYLVQFNLEIILRHY